MIPCKEDLNFFEELSTQQYEIYDDACDFGVWITNQTRNIARKHMMELMKCYGYKMDKWKDGNETKLFIPIERADYGFNQFDGLVLVVTYNRAQTTHPSIISQRAVRASDGFISIETIRKTMTLAEATEQYGYKD